MKELDESQLMYLQLLIDNGCKFKSKTVIFGKTYVWMTDRAGNWFLERIPEYEDLNESLQTEKVEND